MENTRALKIAVYSGEIPSTTFIEGLIKALATEGHQVCLFGKRRKKVTYQNKNIHQYPTPANKASVVFFVLWNRLRLLLAKPERYRLLKVHIASKTHGTTRTWKSWAKYLPVVLHLPDIFHIQWAKSTAEWIFLKDLFGVKLVLSLRGAHINYSPVANASLAEGYRRCFPRLDGFHGVSKAIIEEGRKYGMDPDKSRVVYSGINFQLANAYQKNEYRLHNPVRLLSVGRFHWKKGYHYALDALHKLKIRGADIHYTIIAGSTPPEELLYQIHDLDLVDRVTFSPKLPQQDVFKAMQQADCLLLPSVEEGVANVVLEAMAVGLPVLSSNCGGMPEVIDSGVTGVLFKNRDIQDLTLKLISILNLSNLERQKMAEKGMKTILVNHSMQQLSARLTDLYKDL